MADTTIPLPKYLCHKTVEALKIDHIEGRLGGSAWVYPVNTQYPRFMVSAEYMAKHTPRAGGYWVRYEDGYESFSPATAFESGYVRVEDPSVPSTIDRLEDKLNSDPDAAVNINPDGTVTGLDVINPEIPPELETKADTTDDAPPN